MISSSTPDRADSRRCGTHRARALAAAGVAVLMGAALAGCFPQSSSTSPVASASASSSSSPATGAATLAPSAPSDAELKNATLTIPGSCAAFGMIEGTPGQDAAPADVPESADAAFADGTALGTDGRASVEIQDVMHGELDGTPVAIATFSCFGGGNHAYEAFAVYGPGSDYLGGKGLSSFVWDELGAQVSDPTLERLALAADSFTFEIPQIKTWGDEGCNACGGSGVATVTMTLTDGKLELADAAIRTPTGTVRTVAEADVQSVVDQMAAGDFDAVRAVSGPEMVREFDRVASYRDVPEKDYWALFFPADAHVHHCELLGASTPANASDSTYFFSNGKEFPGAGEAFTGAKPGDTVCGITSDSVDYLSPNADTYESVLLLEGTPDGSVRIRAHVTSPYGD